MKLLLKVYMDEWANSLIQAAYVELTPRYIKYLCGLRRAFLTQQEGNKALQEMVYIDYTPKFLSERDSEEENPIFIAADSSELTIYDVDGYTRLDEKSRVDPEPWATQMTITYLHVCGYGFEWSSRDDFYEDEVTTYQLSWDELEKLERS